MVSIRLAAPKDFEFFYGGLEFLILWLFLFYHLY